MAMMCIKCDILGYFGGDCDVMRYILSEFFVKFLNFLGARLRANFDNLVHFYTKVV